MQRIESREQALAFIEKEIEAVKAQVGDGKVLLALSGGVDSSVVAALLIKAIGKNLVCVHVNHGLLRKGEPEQVVRVFRDEMDANLVGTNPISFPGYQEKLRGTRKFTNENEAIVTGKCTIQGTKNTLFLFYAENCRNISSCCKKRRNSSFINNKNH